MARSKHNVIALVSPTEALRDPLAQKLDELAISMADELKGPGIEMHDKVEALRALSAYFAATRGKGSGAPPVQENAFARYRAEQADAP
jgi:hypothetical protein